MNTERTGAIPGIKKLAQTEEDIRNNRSSIIPGVWYVDGIRSNTGSFEEAGKIAQQHQILIQDFKSLNERINQRAKQKATNTVESGKKEDLVLVK